MGECISGDGKGMRGVVEVDVLVLMVGKVCCAWEPLDGRIGKGRKDGVCLLAASGRVG